LKHDQEQYVGRLWFGSYMKNCKKSCSAVMEKRWGAGRMANYTCDLLPDTPHALFIAKIGQPQVGEGLRSLEIALA
jgi:hypothetical protein